LAYLGEKQELRRTIHLELKEARIRELTYEPRIEKKFPDAASFRISLSSVRSATARRSRAFSASKSFKRLT
jgi:hypothetical protein